MACVSSVLQFALVLLPKKIRERFAHFHNHRQQNFAADGFGQFPIARGPAQNSTPVMLGNISGHKFADHAIPLDRREHAICESAAVNRK